MPDANLLLQVRRSLPPANEKGELLKAAKASGVPFHTLLKIVTGETENPRIKTIQKLLSWASRA